MLGGGSTASPNKNFLITLTARNVGAGVERWDCGVAATASSKATCFHPSASGHDATAHPLLHLNGSSTRPNLATEGSPPQQTPSTGKMPGQTRSLRLLCSQRFSLVSKCSAIFFMEIKDRQWMASSRFSLVLIEQQRHKREKQQKSRG